MRKCLLLTKVLLKGGMGGLAPSSKNGQKRSVSQIALCLLLAVCMIPLICMLFVFGKNMYRMLESVRLDYFAFDLSCLLLSFSTLILGMPFVMSVMFLSRDIEHLLPMPFSAWQIAGAKFLTVLLYEYLVTFAIGLPLFAGISAAARAGVLYIPITLLVLLAIPVLPLIYGSILGVLLLALSTKLRHKEAITTVFSILIVILSMSVGMISSYFGDTADQLAMLQILLGSRRLVLGASRLFPNLPLAQSALANADLWRTLLFVLTALAAFVLFLLIGNRLYLKAVTDMGDVSQKREKMTADEEKRALRSSGVIASYALKEWKLLVRTPVYLLNCVLSAFIVPVMLLAVLLFSSFGNMAQLTVLFTEIADDISSIETQTLDAALLLAVFALCSLFCSMNPTAATCISREGQDYMDMKFIPVPYKKQLQGKLLCALAISYAATLPYTFLLVLGSAALFGTPIWLLPPALAVNILTALLVAYVQLLGDLRKPKLNWSSEQAAVKQNLIASLSILAAMLVCLLIGFAGFLLYRTGLPANAAVTAAVLLLAALTFVLRTVVFRYSEAAIGRL